jgi:hypothetical protein
VPPARESRDIDRARRGLLGGDLVLGRGGLEFFESKFRLVDQPYGPFRPWAVELTLQLGDLQVLMCDHRLIGKAE